MTKKDARNATGAFLAAWSARVSWAGASEPARVPQRGWGLCLASYHVGAGVRTSCSKGLMELAVHRVEPVVVPSALSRRSRRAGMAVIALFVFPMLMQHAGPIGD